MSRRTPRHLGASLGLAAALFAAPAYAGSTAKELVQELKVERTDTDRAKLRQKLAAMGPRAKEALLGSWDQTREENAITLLYLLGELHGDAEVREDLLKASKKSNNRIREVAATCLSGFPHEDTRKQLLRLAEDREERVSIASLEAFAILADPEAFKPLLRLTTRLVGDNPSGPRVVKLQKTFSAILTKHPKKRLLLELCRAAGKFTGESQTAILGVFELGESPVTFPVMRAALAEFLDPRDYDPRPLGRAVGDANAADYLRPISPSLATVAASGLGRARDKESAPLLLKALEAKDAGLRLAALQVLHLTLPKGPRSPGAEAPGDFPALRYSAIQAVMLRLSDRNNRIRDRAHAWLKRETKQNLPRSYPAWKEWSDTYFAYYEAPQ